MQEKPGNNDTLITVTAKHFTVIRVSLFQLIGVNTFTFTLADLQEKRLSKEGAVFRVKPAREY